MKLQYWTNGEPITVPEPYKTYKRPIGGLTFKDEIPELVQADTSTEGDTAEPRLIIPLTSGRDSRDRTDDDLIDSLIVHSYDADLIESHSKRSFKFTKLIDFLSQNLKNTTDYLKCLKIFFRLSY
ncbi:15293_t:CDS:2 [Entrophospora sp. SA101]|nr:15293_t:CDS:2 [Entrophospora sp. SA101]